MPPRSLCLGALVILALLVAGFQAVPAQRPGSMEGPVALSNASPSSWQNPWPRNPAPAIGVGLQPVSSTYDASDGDVYVVNGLASTVSEDGSVSVLNGTMTIATVVVGREPVALVYDSEANVVYVVNSGSDNVSVLRGTSLVGTVAVGPDPMSASYNPGNGFVYVANLKGGNVTVINGLNALGSVPVGGVDAFPYAAAYDAENGYTYVVTQGTVPGTVVEINGLAIMAVVHVEDAAADAIYDAVNGYVYVTNSQNGTVSVLNGSQVIANVSAQFLDVDLLYDPSNECVYVANEDENSVTVINGTRAVATLLVGSDPVNETFDPANGEVYVVAWGATDGSSPQVDLIRGTQLAGAVSVGGGPSSATYDGGDGFVYVTDSGTSLVSILNEAEYTVLFQESGLASGTNWSVTLDQYTLGGNESTLPFTVPNGTYAGKVYGGGGSTVSPEGGDVGVAGANVTVVLTFPLKSGVLGLPGSEGYYVVGGVVALAALGVGVSLVAWKRHRRRTAGSDQPAPPDGSSGPEKD